MSNRFHKHVTNLVIVGLTLLACSITGISFYQDYQEKKRIEQEKAELQATFAWSAQ